jgi:hypothetical protein
MREASPTPEVALPKVAIVLVSGLDPGAAANVAACIAAGLAAARPGWAGRPLADAAGLRSSASSHVPVGVLRAEPTALHALVARLAADGVDADGALSLFPAYARSMHDCVAYWDRHATVSHADEPLLGIGLCGPKRWVARHTGSLPLWR